MSHGFAPQGAPDNRPQRYCPDDRTPLAKVVDSRGNVTVDQCPACGITVLDHGEMERIIATVASQPGFRPASHLVHGSPQYAPPQAYAPAAYHHGSSSGHGYHGDSSGRRQHHHGHHRESFLGELFD